MTARNHDEFIQFKGHTRNQRFQPPKPDNAALYEHNQTPQNPTTNKKMNSSNQYRGHGRGQ
jgi:hypothetical protein